MQEQILNAQQNILVTNSLAIDNLKRLSAHTTEANQPATATTNIPAASLQSGLEDHQKAIIATYQKIGQFDLKRLQVETLDSGFDVFNRHKMFTKDQGRLITIAAHTSHGKTALLMQIAAHIAKDLPVYVHSFEMAPEELETRLLAAIADIPTTMIMEGSVHEAKVKAARVDFAKRRLYVSNIPNRSVNFVLSSLFEISKIYGRPGLVVIDYGQQLRPGGEGNKNMMRVNEITEISAACLTLAQQLKCNVAIGAQMNNEVLKRAYMSQDEDGKMHYLPIISDIREGSSIAHDSYAVITVVRPHIFDRNADKELAELYCLKHRGGELWDASIKWNGSRCQFYEKGSHGL
jgi:replicative DNA helicase